MTELYKANCVLDKREDCNQNWGDKEGKCPSECVFGCMKQEELQQSSKRPRRTSELGPGERRVVSSEEGRRREEKEGMNWERVVTGEKRTGLECAKV